MFYTFKDSIAKPKLKIIERDGDITTVTDEAGHRYNVHISELILWEDFKNQDAFQLKS